MMSRYGTSILVDGVLATSVPATDRGLQYGDGLFETIAVSDSLPRLWERHMRRLVHDAERLGISPPDPERLWLEAIELIAGARCGVLKIILTRGDGQRGYLPPLPDLPRSILSFAELPALPRSLGSPLRVRLCQTILSESPSTAGIKHLNRLPQVLGRAEWRDASIQEGLMFDPDGFLIEGTSTNLFLRVEGCLWTPNLARAGVAGIIRELVLEEAQALGIRVEIGDLSRQGLELADELLLCNSLIGLQAVDRLQDRPMVLGQESQALINAVNRRAFMEDDAAQAPNGRLHLMKNGD